MNIIRVVSFFILFGRKLSQIHTSYLQESFNDRSKLKISNYNNLPYISRDGVVMRGNGMFMYLRLAESGHTPAGNSWCVRDYGFTYYTL